MRFINTHTLETLADPEKRHAWIMHELRLKGLTLFDLARDAGVTRNAVYAIFQRRNPRMQSIVAAALNMRPQDLFPERYNEDGLPLKWLGAGKPQLMPDGKHTTKQRRNNGRNE